MPPPPSPNLANYSLLKQFTFPPKCWFSSLRARIFASLILAVKPRRTGGGARTAAICYYAHALPTYYILQFLHNNVGAPLAKPILTYSSQNMFCGFLVFTYLSVKKNIFLIMFISSTKRLTQIYTFCDLLLN